jgi:uncharacterized membrane protein
MATRPRRTVIAHTADTARLEAFSDGVFAIAITLLILEIAVPVVREGKLAAALLEEWPSYIAYAASFFTIGIMWMNHHFFFGMLAGANRPLILLNLVLLAVVAFIPFPTAVLAEYLKEGFGTNLSSATAFYGGCFLALTLVFTGLWYFALRNPSLAKNPELMSGAARRSLVYCAIAVGGYVAAIVFAYVSPVVSFAIYVSVAVMFLTGRLLPREPVDD